MLDHFLIGAVDRISPEAPVPVVRFDHESYRLGGAANVAHNLAALGAHVEVVGIVGNDEAGRQLRADLHKIGIGSSAVVEDPDRRTTRKLRVVTSRNQQVARIDYEDDREVQGDVEAAIVGRIDQLSGSVGCDSRLGLPQGRDLAGRRHRGDRRGARRRSIPLLVDPKVPHIDYYAGRTVITPNHHEAEAVTHMRIRSERRGSRRGPTVPRTRHATTCS